MEETKEKTDSTTAEPSMDGINPLLGKKTAPREVKVAEEDKEKYFKCFLSDSPFSHTVSLFGNKLNAQFRTLTVDENSEIYKQIAMDQEKGIARNDDGYFIRIVQYRLAASLVQINNAPFAPDITKDTVKIDKTQGTSFVSARAAIVDQWSTAKLAALTDAFNVFELIVKKLTEEVLNESFWKAAA